MICCLLFSLYTSILRAFLSVFFYKFIASECCLMCHSIENKLPLWQKMMFFCVPLWIILDIGNACFILKQGDSLYSGMCQAAFLSVIIGVAVNSVGFLVIPFWSISFALCRTVFEIVLNVGMLAFQFYLRSFFLT